MASSDSGGGAGIQADIRAFAATGCHGMTALAAVTAQNSVGVDAVHAVPAAVLRAQLDSVQRDIGVDAAKTGMLFAADLVATAADFFTEHPVPLVVDPVCVASSGAVLLEPAALEVLIRRLLPLATVVTPNLMEAETLTGTNGSRRQLAERLHELGAAAVIVTGGHGPEPVDHLFDGREHTEIPVARHAQPTTHGAGCTHSAVLCGLLARGLPLVDAAREAAARTGTAVAHGLAGMGAGEGPVDILDIRRRT